MKISLKLFGIVGAFFILLTPVYGVWVRWTEWVGIPAIFALGVMCLMVSFYLWLVDRKYKDGPADREDGEISDYAGTYGTFAPWSWWPLGLGLGCAISLTGLAVDWWVFFIGIGVSFFFVVGWVFEYSKGDHAH